MKSSAPPQRSVLGRDDLLTDVDATKVVPGRPNRSTICRWRLQGIPTPDGGRLYLRYVRAGRRAFIAPEWLDDFLHRLSELERQRPQGDCVAPIPDKPNRPSSRHEQADREAKALGI